MHPIHDFLIQALRIDIDQMVEEGHDRSGLEAELEAAVATGSADAIIALQQNLWGRPSPTTFPYEEPSDWESISAGFPEADASTPFTGSDGDLHDRVLAAWQGRCVGCQLGKPIEGTTWPEKIKQVLELVGSWPLTDYMNPTPAGYSIEQLPDCDFFQRNNDWRNSLCKGRFDHVAPDDDIHYCLISQILLEEKGADFTSRQALDNLLRRSPLSGLWASGRNMFKLGALGFESPTTAILGNPCRQSLGAQIRVDPFGWGAPGNPTLAAAMAYRDAVNSQIRNGIYSGIFHAVMMADVLAHGDVVRAIDTAESYVPPRSRFAEMIRFMKQTCAEESDWEVVNRRMIDRYYFEASKFNHAIPNAAIVILGLLKGRGDFTTTLGITVMAGLDTDCTGATVGSIMGCALGTRGIPSHWTAPLNDSIRSTVIGHQDVTITDMAERMSAVAARNARRG